MMKCRYCGTNLAPGSSVCPTCGKAAESGTPSSFRLKYTSKAALEEQAMREGSAESAPQPDPYGLYTDRGFPDRGASGQAGLSAGGGSWQGQGDMSAMGAPGAPQMGAFGAAAGFGGQADPSGGMGSGFGGQADPSGGMGGAAGFGGARMVEDRAGRKPSAWPGVKPAEVRKQRRKRGLLIFLIVLELAAIACTAVFYFLDPLKMREVKEIEPPYAYDPIDSLAENYVSYLGIGDFTQALMEGCGGETANEAYGKLVRSLESSFGASEVLQTMGQSTWNLGGVCLLDLVDLDHDGIDELLAVCREEDTYFGYLFFYEGGEVYRCFRAESMITSWKQGDAEYLYVDLKDDGSKTLLYIGGQLEEDKSELECYVQFAQGSTSLEKSTTLGPVSRIDGYKEIYQQAKAERDQIFAPFTVSYDDVNGMRAFRPASGGGLTSWCLAGDREDLLEPAQKRTEEVRGLLGI